MTVGSDPLVLSVAGGSPEDLPLAAQLADRLEIPLLPDSVNPRDIADADALLLVRDGWLSLQQTGRGAPGPVTVAFGSAAMRHRRKGGHNELLGRAVGAGKRPDLTVLDATAGLGRDSFVLADLGCRVLLCEREPLLVEMLRAALGRAAADDDPWLQGVVANMRLLPGDATTVSAAELAIVDVIYLDPMFPPREKSSAVKKEMAFLQRLLASGPDSGSAEALLVWALQQKVARVVVKRPARAPVLAGRAPSHALSGKAVRYDVYTLGPWG